MYLNYIWNKLSLYYNKQHNKPQLARHLTSSPQARKLQERKLLSATNRPQVMQTK